MSNPNISNTETLPDTTEWKRYGQLGNVIEYHLDKDKCPKVCVVFSDGNIIEFYLTHVQLV